MQELCTATKAGTTPKEFIMRTIGFAIALLSTLAVAAAAQAGQKFKPKQISCEEFLTLDEQVQPRAVYYVAGYNSAGNLTADEVETDVLVKPVAVGVLEDCKKEPKATLWSKIKSKL
jgi:hypothetical protein